MDDMDLGAIPVENADTEVASVRRPPQSIESEQSVLGGLLLDNNAFDLVADVIGPDDFYRHDHRLIYEKIQQMCTAGQPADVVTVFTALDSEGKAQETGGLAYLSNLATGTPSAARPGTSRSSLTRPRASSLPLTKSPTRVRRVSAS